MDAIINLCEMKYADDEYAFNAEEEEKQNKSPLARLGKRIGINVTQIGTNLF